MLTRRALLTSALLAGSTACTNGPDPTEPSTQPGSPRPTPSGSPSPGGAAGRVLLVYFSRPGENYYYGGRRNLQTGNTEVLAGIISEMITCDTHRIEAADPYPDSYDATVQRNQTEQNADARPAIANPRATIDGYRHVLLGSPIWNTRPPMIMTTFAEAHDFTGIEVHPFVTYAISGLGSTEDVYTTACTGAQISPGLAIQGEEVTQHRGDVETWLRERRLLN